ncbi:MAG: hypothetical protein ACR2IS_05785, partial [Nitrososphaeraceae archaeon]
KYTKCQPVLIESHSSLRIMQLYVFNLAWFKMSIKSLRLIDPILAEQRVRHRGLEIEVNPMSKSQAQANVSFLKNV